VNVGVGVGVRVVASVGVSVDVGVGVGVGVAGPFLTIPNEVMGVEQILKALDVQYPNQNYQMRRGLMTQAANPI
jgi:hypothetical protein